MWHSKVVGLYWFCILEIKVFACRHKAFFGFDSWTVKTTKNSTFLFSQKVVLINLYRSRLLIYWPCGEDGWSVVIMARFPKDWHLEVMDQGWWGGQTVTLLVWISKKAKGQTGWQKMGQMHRMEIQSGKVNEQRDLNEGAENVRTLYCSQHLWMRKHQQFFSFF